MGGVGNISSDLHRTAARSRLRAARVPKKVTSDKSKRSGSGEKKARKPLVTSGVKGSSDYEAFDSVWEAIGFSQQESANLEARSDLMIQIGKIIRRKKWTQTDAAKRCGVSQPRMNDLLRGKIDNFSLDALVNMAASLDQRVTIQLTAA